MSYKTTNGLMKHLRECGIEISGSKQKRQLMNVGYFHGYKGYRFFKEKSNHISDKIGITNVAVDSGRTLVYKYLYALKDLRNAIAHNDVIFDTRFRKIDPTKSMSLNIKKEIGLPYMNFKTIGDYVILTAYYLKMFSVKKIEINAFIREFERITADYAKSVSESVSSVVIHPDLESRMLSLKNYI